MITPSIASVWDLPRNDIEACHRFWQEHRVTHEEWRTMLRLQDDPAELRAAAETWGLARGG
jgi:hypothetical protein